MVRRLLPLLLIIAIGTPVLAQRLADVERILLPLAPERVNGALGSVWQTDVAITNLSDTPLLVTGYEPAGGCGILCAPPPIPAHATIFVYTVPHTPEVRGANLFIEKGRTADLAATLRVRDLSRQSETWGTTIPVVTPARRCATRFSLVDVPMDTQFRATLRIYDADATTPGSIRLRIYSIDPNRDFPRTTTPDTLLVERTMTFTTATTGGGTTFLPGSIELPLWTDPALAGTARVRIEIEPLTTEQDYWGFVSITHNTTQHVTVITPE